MTDKDTANPLTLDHSDLPAILQPPGPDGWLLVLAHGAGAGMTHGHMTSIAAALADRGIGTLRFNFPFTHQGRRRVDSQDISTQTIEQAVNTASRLVPDAKLLIGGHSFGGRMATHYATRADERVRGLVLFSFPLHPAGKPGTSRADHLQDIPRPMLFLSGDRDKLAEPELLTEVLGRAPLAQLYWLHTADHSYHILKRTRTLEESVYEEAAAVTAAFVSSLE